MVNKSMDIPCIGLLAGDEIVSAAGLTYSDFGEKSVFDAGCGVGDFLKVVKDSTEATRLVGVDPIFETTDSLQQGIEDTRHFIHRAMRTEYIGRDTLNKLRVRLDAIDQFSSSDEGIDYHHDISTLGRERFDFMFSSFVFRHLSETLKRCVIQEMDLLKAPGGSIYVIDCLVVLEQVQGIVGKGSIKKYSGTASCLRI